MWHLYFWVFIASIVLAYSAQEFWRIWESVDVIATGICCHWSFRVYLEAYVFCAIILASFLPLFIIWNGYYLYVLPLPVSILEKYPLSQFAIATPTFLFGVPLFFALYFYAFSREVGNPVPESSRV